jgi:rhodanese-related sulfurtransferase
VYGPSRVPTVTIAEVSDETYLLDVRDEEEWVAGHAPRAHHLPMMELPDRLAEVPDDREVVVICRVGARSAQVVAYLQANGWDRVYNLDGGMCSYEGAGRLIVSEDGSAARVI